MTTLTLLVKAYSSRQLNLIGNLLQAQFEELDVDATVSGVQANKWVQVSVSGEDEGVAASYIKKEFGTCPVSLKKIGASSILKGYISKVDSAQQQLVIDVGVFEPKVIPATVSLSHLKAELFGGKELVLKKISELYGLVEDIPLSIKIVEVDAENGILKAKLSLEQVEKLRLWRDSLLDRLIILRLSLNEVERVVERTRLERDVIGVETLGTFEHALTCKLGTDATGLISRVGRYMRNGKFVVFNPRKIRDFLDEKGSTL